MIRKVRDRAAARWSLVAAGALALCCAAVLSVSGATGASEAPGAPRGTAIAAVNLSRVLRRCAQWQDVTEERNRLLESRQRALNKLVRQAQVLRNDQENLPPGSEERQLKTAELKQALDELERKRQQFEAEAMKQYSEATRAMLARIDQAVSAYAQEQGLQLVLQSRDLAEATRGAKDPQSVMNSDVLYAAAEMDISDAIIAALDAAYQGPIQVK